MAVNSGGIPAAEVDELEASGEAEEQRGKGEEVGWAFRLLAASRRGRSSYTASSTEQREQEEERERESERD